MIASLLAASASSFSLSAHAQTAPIIQPGAPGQADRELAAEEAIRIADTRYSADDVRFMQDMIPHHQQAVEMAALVADRTNQSQIIDIAGRITASQADEIDFMKGWLSERGQPAAMAMNHSTMDHSTMDHSAMNHDDHAMSAEMMGMASPEQMNALAEANGVAFDRLFLELMIAHHKGAVRMVEDLLAQPGSAYDPVLFEFVNDVTNDQTAEIEQMNAILVGLSQDPRAGLAAGFRDAGSAILNLELVASLPKPAGFFDPNNPAGLPPEKPSKDEDERSEDAQSNEDTEWGERSPRLSFANTDMAFSGDVLVTGNYHGFNVYKLSNGADPRLISSVVCPGGQGDVSIVGNILIMSVEQTNARTDCGLQGVSADVSADRFRGLRIFDITDLTRPRQVGQVQTCRGSHTHSVVSGPGRDGKIVVYVSGTGSVRDEEELAGCIGEVPGDNRTALFRIDVVEIPVNDPSKARIVDSPTVFADPKTGQIAGLWKGGDHGDETQVTSLTDECHDITVYPAANLAAGACSGNGIIFDISNPRKPKRIDAVTDTGFAYWHSATFNNDGTKVLFTDEWGGGSRPRCRAHDQKTWGANAIYDIIDGKLEFRSHFKLPAPQVEEENCVAHNGSIIPVPGRDIFAQAWYQGGVSVIDFTDSENPFEIAYFDRGPINEENLILGGYWSSYWYDGRIYATEITRGLDVFDLKESAFLTANEIAAAKLADQGEVFNPQQQFPVSWPARAAVAHAYIDQLSRDKAITEPIRGDLTAVLKKADAAIAVGGRDAQLAERLASLASVLPRSSNADRTDERLRGLNATLTAMAKELR